MNPAIKNVITNQPSRVPTHTLEEIAMKKRTLMFALAALILVAGAGLAAPMGVAVAANAAGTSTDQGARHRTPCHPDASKCHRSRHSQVAVTNDTTRPGKARSCFTGYPPHRSVRRC